MRAQAKDEYQNEMVGLLVRMSKKEAESKFFVVFLFLERIKAVRS